MKTNEDKFQKRRADLLRQAQSALMLLRKVVYGRPTGDDAGPDAVPETPPAQRQSPLDRITEHLQLLGLGQRVHVRFEAAGGDYVLEDADGSIHARDFDDAVKLIERIWLYEP